MAKQGMRGPPGEKKGAGTARNMYAVAHSEGTAKFSIEAKGAKLVASKEEETVSRPNEEFFPKGAIAFFASMLIGFGLIWLGMYLLMVHRH